MKEQSDRDPEEPSTQQPTTLGHGHHEGQDGDHTEESMEDERSTRQCFGQWHSRAEGHHPVVDHGAAEDLGHRNWGQDYKPEKHGSANEQPVALGAVDHCVVGLLLDLVKVDG